MITVRTQNAGFTGERSGVTFKNGSADVGTLTEKQRNFFNDNGYIVSEPIAEVEVPVFEVVEPKAKTIVFQPESEAETIIFEPQPEAPRKRK